MSINNCCCPRYVDPVSLPFINVRTLRYYSQCLKCDLQFDYKMELEEPLNGPNRDTNNSTTYDDILLKVGEFGRFQVVLSLAFSIAYLETAAQLVG